MSRLTTSATSVAVVGLGAMGSRIAGRLLAAGHDVTVWNLTAVKTQPLIGLGASAVPSPAEAARRAEVVVTMVSDPEALPDVTEGPDGVAAGATGSTTIIQMSTVGPPALSRLASVLPPGAGLLDAPVLGSVSEAETGSLTIFVGGPSELVERWTPLLSTLGAPTVVGALGAGTAAKLIANAALFGVLALLGEALSLATRLGLPMRVAFDVLDVTSLASQARRRRAAIDSGEFPPRFALRLARKDADLIVAAAAAAGAELSVGSAARSDLVDADEAGWSECDYSGVLAHLLGAGWGGRR